MLADHIVLYMGANNCHVLSLTQYNPLYSLLCYAHYVSGYPCVKSPTGELKFAWAVVICVKCQFIGDCQQITLFCTWLHSQTIASLTHTKVCRLIACRGDNFPPPPQAKNIRHVSVNTVPVLVVVDLSDRRLPKVYSCQKQWHLMLLLCPEFHSIKFVKRNSGQLQMAIITVHVHAKDACSPGNCGPGVGFGE